MRKLSIFQLLPGMVAAEDIISRDGQMVIPKGTILTDKWITRLTLYGILTAQVEDVMNTPSFSGTALEPSYSMRIKRSQEFKEFKARYETTIDSFRDMINNMVERNITLDVKELLRRSLDMITATTGRISILDMLQNMREYDDSTFAHCLNAALICNVFSNWLGWNKEKTELATACGMLHDVGKLLVPLDIITKPGKLSDEEFDQIKQHPKKGYELLLSQNVDSHICNAALMHHERCDGTGYPMGLVDDQIDIYSKMVAIADVYDAMTAARVYRGPLCPFKVIEVIETDGLQKYDVHLVLTFLENVVNTYIQNRCRLSDGRIGTIIYVNKDKLGRPIVQCGGEYVNLAVQPELYIETLL